jgi:uncharacterized membrane protein
MRTIFRYFLRGVLFVLPLGLTVYIIVAAIIWVDSLIPFEIPGLGTLIILAGITVLGYLISLYISTPLLKFLDGIIMRVPVINIIYSSIKDLSEAFIGEKRKFKAPVLVEMTSTGIQKIGFITQEDLSQFGLRDKVAVYFPHSYNFSGNLFIVPVSRIERISTNSTETMKYIISAGIAGFHTEDFPGEEH